VWAIKLREGVRHMNVQFIVLAVRVAKQHYGFSGKGDWIVLKCFFDKNGQYGEFYINMNLRTWELEIVAKDPIYRPVLTDAFSQAMGR
jgi:hypothetical protein